MYQYICIWLYVVGFENNLNYGLIYSLNKLCVYFKKNYPLLFSL